MNENQFTEEYENLSAELNAGSDAGGPAERAKTLAQDARTIAQDAAGNVRAQAGEAYARGEEYVRANPIPVVLGALAVGLLVGIAIARHEEDEPSARKRYVDEPLEHSREALLAILGPVAKRLRDQYGDARSSVEKAADGIDCDPILKQVRRFSDKLKFW